ncbi:MAG TPA: sulfatase-like hydrolase/transferase, partial [Solirubrobacterales bacterium]|nr:sulfatase-like hydrolase/transferase [Solirubrobacterales bacterium]
MRRVGGTRVALAVAVLAAALLAGCGGGSGEKTPATNPVPEVGERPSNKGPNLLVVMVDDQTVGSFTPEIMPGVTSFFDEAGSVFGQAIAAPPLCCPARAGFLTGRYAHNNGVVENDIGYPTMRGKDRTFPVALQRAGYRTGMIGKFLNGYDRENGADPAPGFDRWYAMLGSAEYRDFEVSDQGERGFASGYATRVLTDEAREFMDRGGRRPFFLWLSYNA